MPYVTQTFPQGAHDVNTSSDTKISPDISTARARIASPRRPVVLAQRPDVIPHPTFARLPITARADVDASVAIVVPRALTPSAPESTRPQFVALA